MWCIDDFERKEEAWTWRNKQKNLQARACSWTWDTHSTVFANNSQVLPYFRLWLSSACSPPWRSRFQWLESAHARMENQSVRLFPSPLWWQKAASKRKRTECGGHNKSTYPGFWQVNKEDEEALLYKEATGLANYRMLTTLTRKRSRNLSQA